MFWKRGEDPQDKVQSEECYKKNVLHLGPFGSEARTISALSKTGRFLSKAEIVVVGMFSSLPMHAVLPPIN